MFYLLAAASAIAYGIQSAFLVPFARKFGGAATSMWRNISLCISMLPLLLFVPLPEIAGILNYKTEILLAGFCSATGNLCSYGAFNYLPAGVVSSLRQSWFVLGSIGIGLTFLSEVLSNLEIFFISIILIGIFLLGTARVSLDHLDGSKATYGFFLSTISGLFTSLGFYFMISISKNIHPFIAGYFWEFIIAMFAIILFYGRKKIGKEKAHSMDLKTFTKILLAASPTLIGTGAFAFAIHYGPFNIASAFGVLSSVACAIACYFLFKEKLKLAQVIGIILVLGAIVGIKVF